MGISCPRWMLCWTTFKSTAFFIGSRYPAPSSGVIQTTTMAGIAMIYWTICWTSAGWTRKHEGSAWRFPELHSVQRSSQQSTVCEGDCLSLAKLRLKAVEEGMRWRVISSLVPEAFPEVTAKLVQSAGNCVGSVMRSESELQLCCKVLAGNLRGSHPHRRGRGFLRQHQGANPALKAALCGCCTVPVQVLFEVRG